MLQYNREELGDFLAKARAKANMTQAQVAEDLGYSSAQFISNIERGVSVAPLNVISKMIKLYRCNHQEVVRIMIESQMKLLLKALKQKA